MVGRPGILVLGAKDIKEMKKLANMEDPP